MLCQFTFKNFKSYKYETILDFQAANDKELSNTLLRNEGSDACFLPVISIYGPNGGGKSGVIEALCFFISAISNPIYSLTKRYSYVTMFLDDYEPFKFDDNSQNEPTEFDVYYRVDNYEFHYFLSFYNKEIHEEYLFRRKLGAKKSSTIFERSEGNITLGNCLKSNRINIEVKETMPFLSFLAISYNNTIINQAASFFINNVCWNYANPNLELIMPSNFNEDFKKIIIKMLNNMDIDISNFYEKTDDNKHTEIITERIINGTKFKLNMKYESEGTKKVFKLLPLIVRVLSEGKLLIVDELDAKLHPKLLKYIIMLFKNPNINKKHAQLIFTSHNITIMNHNIFRRDEILFACIDEKRSSYLYSLYDIRDENNERIRQNAPFDKQYIEGRYGADPYLKSILSWSDINE